MYVNKGNNKYGETYLFQEVPLTFTINQNIINNKVLGGADEHR